MFGRKVELSDEVKIPNNQDLFCAKFLNEEHRKLVLTRAKSLRHTEYADIPIHLQGPYLQVETGD